MKLCVSQIAWLPEEDDEAHGLLAELGVKHLEAAPTRHFPHGLDQAPDGAFRGLRERAEAAGLTFRAMQALLFSRPRQEGEAARTAGLQVFGNEASRAALADYLKTVVTAAAALGAGPLVFGSPGNRRRGSLTDAEAEALAVPLFREAGAAAAAAGCVIVVEANPAAYHCDWLTRTSEAAAFVAAVDSAGVGLHWDCGGAQLSGEDPLALLPELAPRLRHYHVSVPFLKEPGEEGWPHRESARLLRDAGYDGCVSLEMARSPRGLEGLREAVLRLQDWYS